MEPLIRSIGNISNYYGGLQVKEENGVYYWGIENWNVDEWERIPETLYRALLDYETTRQKGTEDGH